MADDTRVPVGPNPVGTNSVGTINAPEFPDGAEWLNTARPLKLRDLRGKFVLLDFWTYCCINCQHVLPDLKKLEKKYPAELVVVGVHSAKFQAERETENIRQAVLRHEVEHPVINDFAMELWQQYAVRSWPTLILIDPLGKLVVGHSGERVFDPIDQIIEQLIPLFDSRGLLDRQPLEGKLEQSGERETLLSFPGKVLADEKGGRLFIADSNHNRILVASLRDGSILEEIGQGDSGLKDGDFRTATFQHPQGMALREWELYVADTENHAIRRVDLRRKVVETVAGTGRQGYEFNPPPRAGSAQPLNSPWDLESDGDALYVAMAGPHQIWKMELEDDLIGPYAGNGQEALHDGPLASAALAQPSGISSDGQKLYFADSEVSSIRSADLNPDGRVETLVGGGLFQFGDRDGVGADARLQHPLGVVWCDGSIFVADTYNNKIKRVNPAARKVETFVGSGEAGWRDGKGATAQFMEPAGVSAAAGKLYVADTNNHRIRVVDIKTRRVSTFELAGAESLKTTEKG